MLKRATLLIPLTFNDGTIVPRPMLAAMEREIFLTFQGWTLVGEVKGAYQMQQTGQKNIDRLLHVWVVLEESDIPKLRDMIARFGTTLGQVAMYLEISESHVELVPPRVED
ncbi:MAG TPA: hypothetical protein VFE62_04260 [Gemmataceae bacterium]|nr:hypothetical protein [Gemmataceae bacterium]